MILFLLIVGAKFWHTSKIIKALSLSDYSKLERYRSGEGPSSSSKRNTSSPVLLSDSDSSQGSLIRSFLRKRKRHHVPTPPELSDTESLQNFPRKEFRATTDVKKVLDEIKGDLDKWRNECQMKKINQSGLENVFTCLICQEVATIDKETVMPTCCRSVLYCKECIAQWLQSSAFCPHCREELSIELCQPQPQLKPLFELIQNN